MLTDFVRLALGEHHSMILKQDGSVWSTPVNLRGLDAPEGVAKYFERVVESGVTDVAAGMDFCIGTIVMHPLHPSTPSHTHPFTLPPHTLTPSLYPPSLTQCLSEIVVCGPWVEITTANWVMEQKSAKASFFS